MSLEEIKKELAGLSEKDQAEATTFLFHLRRISKLLGIRFSKRE
ncbi:MAG TPA: hypothetical protein VMN36_05810 [Verrucomicrobiales bacterium]|nr:hypothetical protein [Verrucomicrobiales bacterium]